MFERAEQARACESAITDLRSRLHLPPDFEFHFAEISNDLRAAFFAAVEGHEFSYTACVVFKRQLSGREWDDKGHFYREVAGLIVGNLEEDLRIARECKGRILNAKVTVDDNRDPAYLKALKDRFGDLRDGDGRPLVEKVRWGRSRSETLLQLADMVCGAVVRAHQGEPVHRRLVKHREGLVAYLPLPLPAREPEE